MERVDFSSIKITGGFWASKQELVRNVTVKAVYDRFYETGRFDAFKCDENAPIKPHIFWDSDVAKWIEGVAYLTHEKREPELEKIVDGVVDEIEKNQDENGYFNSFFLLPDERKNQFKYRDCHELYCLGHLIEAAVAYYNATGKDKLLKLMCKYVDYVEKVFKIQKSAGFLTPGHEEIELALVRLYECTGEKRYLELSKYFVDTKGTEASTLTEWAELHYCQSHKPVREQEAAEGHAVRATYLYCAMADLALKYGDKELKAACEKIFDNIATKRMYITGGIGSSRYGEAFTVDYDLPNLISYTESCAALGLALFAHRMLLLTNDRKYADVVERAIYNGFLSSISLDGKSFFYTNPLEIIPYMIERDTSQVHKNQLCLPDTQRKEVFDCSCCPPNIVRFIPSIANFIYTTQGDTIYIHQFMDSEAEIKLGDKIIKIKQETTFPYGGKVKITTAGGKVRLAVRVPGWSSMECDSADGYLYTEQSQIELDFMAKPRFAYANTSVLSDLGKCALCYGPLVYCMEKQDNPAHPKSILIDSNTEPTIGYNEQLGVKTLIADCYILRGNEELYSFTPPTLERGKATFIPYFAFANRGQDDMLVWCQYK
ncbi:MAG: glycoside hydrolase family 127 protein [Clostridia bacterium]|nr:glycoside hydrolase family 127 protein [Clostridia bacterium]